VLQSLVTKGQATSEIGQQKERNKK